MSPTTHHIISHSILTVTGRNGMRDPIVVGLHVWRGEDGRGVETREL